MLSKQLEQKKNISVLLELHHNVAVTRVTVLSATHAAGGGVREGGGATTVSDRCVCAAKCVEQVAASGHTVRRKPTGTKATELLL